MKGHQIMLFNVQEFNYNKMEHGITISIKHENEEIMREVYIPYEIPIQTEK